MHRLVSLARLHVLIIFIARPVTDTNVGVGIVFYQIGSQALVGTEVTNPETGVNVMVLCNDRNLVARPHTRIRLVQIQYG